MTSTMISPPNQIAGSGGLHSAGTCAGGGITPINPNARRDLVNNQVGLDYAEIFRRMMEQQNKQPADWKQPARLLQAIRARLRVDDDALIDWVEHIEARCSGEKVFVWVIKDGEATIIEDDADLFPSDRLTTQLRMLRG